MAHPGARRLACAQKLQTWWQAAVEGLDVTQAVQKYPELSVSVSKFGKKLTGHGRLQPTADLFLRAMISPAPRTPWNNSRWRGWNQRCCSLRRPPRNNWRGSNPCVGQWRRRCEPDHVALRT